MNIATGNDSKISSLGQILWIFPLGRAPQRSPRRAARAVSQAGTSLFHRRKVLHPADGIKSWLLTLHSCLNELGVDSQLTAPPGPGDLCSPPAKAGKAQLAQPS